MADAKRQTTEFLQCSHCGNRAPMNIGAEYYLSTNDAFDDPYYEDIYPQPEEGYHYKLLGCLACKRVTLQSFFASEYMDDEYIEVETLYPAALKLSGLPSQVQQAYEIALKVRIIDANAYAVLLGRILEMICEDRKAMGKDLYNKLNDLATRGEIPIKLVGVADSLRQLRNFGAHASLGKLTHEEIPILDDLCRAILEYVYNAPYLVEKAAQRLNRLKEKKSKKPEENNCI